MSTITHHNILRPGADPDGPDRVQRGAGLLGRGLRPVLRPAAAGARRVPPRAHCAQLRAPPPGLQTLPLLAQGGERHRPDHHSPPQRLRAESRRLLMMSGTRKELSDVTHKRESKQDGNVVDNLHLKFEF